MSFISNGSSVYILFYFWWLINETVSWLEFRLIKQSFLQSFLFVFFLRYRVTCLYIGFWFTSFILEVQKKKLIFNAKQYSGFAQKFWNILNKVKKKGDYTGRKCWELRCYSNCFFSGVTVKSFSFQFSFWFCLLSTVKARKKSKRIK